MRGSNSSGLVLFRTTLHKSITCHLRSLDSVVGLIYCTTRRIRLWQLHESRGLASVECGSSIGSSGTTGGRSRPGLAAAVGTPHVCPAASMNPLLSCCPASPGRRSGAKRRRSWHPRCEPRGHSRHARRHAGLPCPPWASISRRRLLPCTRITGTSTASMAATEPTAPNNVITAVLMPIPDYSQNDGGEQAALQASKAAPTGLPDLQRSRPSGLAKASGISCRVVLVARRT